ncbi:hypothetical protein C0J52_24469 [Blattella germanica]|nr:hypothetical protein C0J52_24469 [Blattella germanica]
MENEGEIIPSERNGFILAHNGYLYNLNSRNRNRTKAYWICKKKPTCTKRATTTAPNGCNVQVLKSQEHEHPSSHEEVDALRRYVRLKRSADNEPTAAPAHIIQRELERVPSEVLPHLPLRESLKRTINRRRQQHLPANPKAIAELRAIPNEFRVTRSGESFLMYDTYDDHDSEDEDEYDRIIVYASKNHIRKLHRSTIWYIDGTFKTAPDIFTQIVTVHGKYVGHPFPFIYSLLPNKRQSSYEVILRSIIQKCSDYGWDAPEPSVVISDFEMGIIRAVTTVFPCATLRLCFFHLKQSAWRKMQDLGLQAAYNNADNGTIRRAFAQILSLAFVPVEDIADAFRTVLQEIPIEMIDFAKYFENTYIAVRARGRRPAAEARFPPIMWNQFQATRSNEPRTNNSTEAWHNRFQTIVGKNHPSLYKLIRNLQKEESDIQTMIQEVDVGRSKKHKK